ncbi:MAG TPA: hypothetical protein VFC19_29170 [Candidatus Limnocylindrales bacterium]|nr:hypothetical protein [Candidatus Limnocylindrales bacterium]
MSGDLIECRFRIPLLRVAAGRHRRMAKARLLLRTGVGHSHLRYSHGAERSQNGNRTDA